MSLSEEEKLLDICITVFKCLLENKDVVETLEQAISDVKTFQVSDRTVQLVTVFSHLQEAMKNFREDIKYLDVVLSKVLNKLVPSKQECSSDYISNIKKWWLVE